MYLQVNPITQIQLEDMELADILKPALYLADVIRRVLFYF